MATPRLARIVSTCCHLTDAGRRRVDRPGWSALIVALLACSPLGCAPGGGSAGGSCTINSDCPLPEVCIERRCQIQCRVDSDCPANEQCVDSICRDPLAGCLSDADCTPFGLVCDIADRRCVDATAEGDGGPVDPRPDAGRPRDAGETPLDARVRPDARVEPDARVATDRGPPVDLAPPLPDRALPDRALPDMAPPDMAPQRGDAAYGEACTCAIDCASGFCLQNPLAGGAGQCTALCPDQQCPGTDICVQAQVPAPGPACPDPGVEQQPGEVVSICAPNDTGYPCRGPGDCPIGGTCVTPPDPVPAQYDVQAVCGAPCAADGDCPVGFRCEAVPVQGGQQVQICTAATQVAACPDGSNRACGGVCPGRPGADPLDISLCLVLDQGPGGYCSCTCRDGRDCPLGFACSPGVLDTGDPGRPGVCLPMAGYTCPMGESQCMSLLCAPPVGEDPFSRCAAPCGGPGDCPQGHDCVPVPDSDLSVCVVQ